LTIEHNRPIKVFPDEKKQLIVLNSFLVLYTFV